MRGFGRPPAGEDGAERSELVVIGLLCGGSALVLGAALGFLFGWSLIRGAFVLGIPMAFASTGLAYFIVSRAGAVAGGLHTPGGGPPRRAALSGYEALIVAGRFEDAVIALTDASAEYPDDPRPALMLAELYRDDLGEFEKAAAWFRRAAAVPKLSMDGERQILRALVELCCDKTDRPELAAPALSRAASLHAGDRLGHWAQQELRALRARPGPTSADLG